MGRRTVEERATLPERPPSRPVPVPPARKKRRRRRKGRQVWTLPAWVPAFLASRWAEALLVLILFLAALAIRWPYLLRLPHFTDETVEISWAMAIWRDGIRPLTASDRYYGPLHPYIVAACFWLFGPSIVLPRAIVMVFGALTVVLTYLLGRALAGRAAGLIGAGLMATAAQHIIVNSHIAWQNSTTPFYATLAFLALTLYLNAERGTRNAEFRPAAGEAPRPPADQIPRSAFRVPHFPHGLWLVLAGVAYGLTLHTHPGTIVLAPALALTFLGVVWRARAWRVFRTPWPWLAPLAGIAAYSPVLIFNLTNELAGVRRVQTRRNYAYEMNLTWEKYWQNQGDLWLQLARMVSNPMRIPQERAHYLTSPFLALMVGLCLAGIVILLRRRQPLPLLALLSTALIMPAFNKAYGQTWDRYMLTGRYVTFLLPLAFIAAAVAVLALVERGMRGAEWGIEAGRKRRATPSSGSGFAFRVPRSAFAAVLALPILALILYPLIPLRRYYTHEAAKDPANASFLATIDWLRENRDPRTPIVIGRLLAKVDLKDGADAREILDLLLDLEPMPHTSPQDTLAGIQQVVANAPPGDPEALPLIIMMRDECFQMADRRPYQRVSERYRLRELYWALPSYYAIYRYVPEGQPGGCVPATGPEPGE